MVSERTTGYRPPSTLTPVQVANREAVAARHGAEFSQAADGASWYVWHVARLDDDSAFARTVNAIRGADPALQDGAPPGDWS